MRPERTRTGVEAAVGDPRVLGGTRIGLLTNFTGTTPDLGRTVDALVAAGAPVTALFGPEHGLNGSAQAGETERSARDATTGLPVFDTYLRDGGELDELVVESGVDTIVFDMQDIGVRFYTYIWSMYDCMRAAARTGVRFVVLDRPNPLGGAVTCGPGLDAAGYGSFVGRSDIRMRHGLTAGELARLFNSRDLPAEGLRLDLDVVPMSGWDAAGDFDRTRLPWVAPSPNMPTLDSAFAFCGTGLFEGTNVSEGRGTTRPFETLGAPYIDGRLAPLLREADTPGVVFREIWFTPTFHKYAGETIRGVALHITDRSAADPVGTALTVLDAIAGLYPDRFGFLPPGERVDGVHRGYAVDRLWGSAALRETVVAGRSARALHPGTAPVGAAYDDTVLLYPRVFPAA